VLLVELERCAAALGGKEPQRQLKAKKKSKRGRTVSAFMMEI
jgi:hypothetical protein